MEIGVTILLFVCMTALLYVILSLKITRQVDLQMKEFYKTRIHADIQEFYREMEGYAALFDNRIQRFRSLVEREPDAPAKPVEEILKPAPVVARKPEPIVAKGKKSQKVTKKAVEKITPKKSARIPVKPVTIAKKIEPVRPAIPRVQARAPIETQPDDSAIAAELMRELDTQDEFRPTRAENKKDRIAQAVEENTSATATTGSSMSELFSKLGRAVKPMIFGEEKPSPVVAPKILVHALPPEEIPAPKITGNFSEVLRRAEQIKAEKKAERERSEVAARAEFYATDTYVPQRNTLAVKELDDHTKKFLIDSLSSDPSYKKQAFRALIENGVQLGEIAALSKIDIGELELMRQLGRF